MTLRWTVAVAFLASACSTRVPHTQHSSSLPVGSAQVVPELVPANGQENPPDVALPSQRASETKPANAAQAEELAAIRQFLDGSGYTFSDLQLLEGLKHRTIEFDRELGVLKRVRLGNDGQLALTRDNLVVTFFPRKGTEAGVSLSPEEGKKRALAFAQDRARFDERFQVDVSVDDRSEVHVTWLRIAGRGEAAVFPTVGQLGLDLKSGAVTTYNYKPVELVRATPPRISRARAIKLGWAATRDESGEKRLLGLGLEVRRPNPFSSVLRTYWVVNFEYPDFSGFTERTFYFDADTGKEIAEEEIKRSPLDLPEVASAFEQAVQEIKGQGEAVGPALPPKGAASWSLRLVPVGSFSPDLLSQIASAVEAQLGVPVSRNAPIPLPEEAYYLPRKRYRAEKLAEHLLSNASGGERVLGLAEVDISTTKGRYEDWGVVGLAYRDGSAGVMSSFRITRGDISKETIAKRSVIVALHEIGHMLGLTHCEEEGCLMRDAEGTLKYVDQSSGTFGPACAAKLEALGFNLPPPVPR